MDGHISGRDLEIKASFELSFLNHFCFSFFEIFSFGIFFEKLEGSTCADDAHIQLDEAFGKFEDSGFIVNTDQSIFHGQMRHNSSFGIKTPGRMRRIPPNLKFNVIAEFYSIRFFDGLQSSDTLDIVPNSSAQLEHIRPFFDPGVQVL